ncbi:hypothetical protein H2203_008250 [Taxawa tesnikishii (nom. ined.)]|nr:hypothetical protein H2203_008250 [Dothideales sp. JES 119]
MSTPRLRLSFVLAAVALLLITRYTLFSDSDISDVARWKQGSSSHVQEEVAHDSDIVKALKLSPSFEYRRHCLLAHPKRGLTRESLVNVSQSLFSKAFDLVAESLPDSSLPPCPSTTKIDVPYFDFRARVDTSALMLGMATTLKRIEDSLPPLSRWLSNTKSTLVVVLVDQPDLNAVREGVENVRSKAEKLGMSLIFEPYPDPKATEGLKNFALAAALQKNRRPETQWFAITDDDTFFLNLPRVLDALKPYDSTKPYYIGALTEGLFRIRREGFKAWGGGFGDLLWRDCILEVTSPTVKLTQLAGLNQQDIWGTSLASTSPSWHFYPVPLAHLVADVAGPDTFLQRYKFADDAVLTNGYSSVRYPNGLPDLHRAELTFVEDVNLHHIPDRLEFHHSMGQMRPALDKKDKLSWRFEHAAKAKDGSVRQFYVMRGQGGKQSPDSVIEVDWRKG